MGASFKEDKRTRVVVEPERARKLLVFATGEDEGIFTFLRLGRDPGSERMAELRVALRVLWREWRTQIALPFDISSAAAIILHFQDECRRNLTQAGQARDILLTIELPDLVQGAFDLLSGSNADGWVIRRPDLYE